MVLTSKGSAESKLPGQVVNSQLPEYNQAVVAVVALLKVALRAGLEH